MKRSMVCMIVFLGFIAWMVVLPLNRAQAHGDDEESASGHSHEKSEKHGGDVTMTEHFHFEVVFDENDIRVYVYDMDQNPLSFSSGNISGSVTLEFKDASRKPETFPLQVVAKKTPSFSMKPSQYSKDGGTTPSLVRAFSPHETDQDFLLAFTIKGKTFDSLREINFSAFHPGDVKALFTINGLGKEGHGSERFVETLGPIHGSSVEESKNHDHPGHHHVGNHN